MAIVVALAAAFLYAMASVLQQWEAERQPPERALRPSLLTQLLRRPRWLAGLVLDMSGYVVQWIALAIGSLVVVQPLLVVGLLFALPVKARLSLYRMRTWDWAGAVLTTAGLGVFLVVSKPATGHTNVRSAIWALLLCAAAALTVVLVVIGRGSSARWRAMAFGTSAGIVYGVCAALTKSCAHRLTLGVSDLFGSWQPYLLVVAGIGGMILAQSAFQAGPLDASLPTISATDPVVSVVIGAVAFGEAIRSGLTATTLEVLSLAAMVAGIFMLAHTHAVDAAEGGHREVTKPREAV
ncbi:MAG: DMT family transporter [Acidimicrobiales bacterium]